MISIGSSGSSSSSAWGNVGGRADGEHDRAVGSDRVGPAVGGSPGSPSVTGLQRVVCTAPQSGIDLIGRTSVSPLVGVMDIAEIGGEVAARVLAMADQQLRRLAAAPVKSRCRRPRSITTPSASTTTRRTWPASAARRASCGRTATRLVVSHRRSRSSAEGSASTRWGSGGSCSSWMTSTTSCAVRTSETELVGEVMQYEDTRHRTSICA